LLQERSVSAPFKVDTIEYLKNPLTNDQVRDILTFLDYSENPAVFSEFLRKDAPKATTVEDVQAILAEDPALMQRPLVVDWASKKAVIGRVSSGIAIKSAGERNTKASFFAILSFLIHSLLRQFLRSSATYEPMMTK